MYPFNVRVYGLLINDHNQILISDEEEHGFRFSKFPGGGLEYGEGLIDGLKREFLEECDSKIAVIRHFYTTDFFTKSVFNDSQVISIYYLIKNIEPLNISIKEKIFDFDSDSDILQSFRFINLTELNTDDVTFSTDQKVVELLKSTWKKER